MTSWYKNARLPEVCVGLRHDRCMGDSDVTLRIEVEGRLVFSRVDPPIAGMALSRDATRLFIQTGPGDTRREETIDLATGARLQGVLHPSSRAEIVPLTSFRQGNKRLAPTGDGCLLGPPFQLNHPARTRAVGMSDRDRLSALQAALERPPGVDAWRRVCGIFEQWSGPGGQRGVELAAARLEGWPIELRTKPRWLDWLTPGPLWALVVSPVKTLKISGRYIGDEGVGTLLDLPALSDLEDLELSRCAIGPGGAQLIARALSLAGLRRLCLYQNPIGDQGAAALAAAAHLEQLRELHVMATDISRNARRALRGANQLPARAKVIAGQSFGTRSPRQPPRPEGHALPGTHCCVPGLDAALESGEVDAADDNGRTLLFDAVAPSGGCLRCARLLLDAGADPGRRAADGSAVLDALRAGVDGTVGAASAAMIERVLEAAQARSSGQGP